MAAAAKASGHSVTLISGPTTLTPPRGVRVEMVESAREMLKALREPFRECDALVMTAAVADYRPQRRVPGKIRKGKGPLLLTLVRNPDILETLGASKGTRIVIGFALEAELSEKRALEKLKRKNMDYVVLNDPTTLSSDRIRCTILSPTSKRALNLKTKKQAARILVQLLEKAGRTQ